MMRYRVIVEFQCKVADFRGTVLVVDSLAMKYFLILNNP